LAAAVLDKCHLRVEGEVSAEKERDIGKSAFERLLSDLDRTNPGVA
jgi:hypothetical protein